MNDVGGAGWFLGLPVYPLVLLVLLGLEHLDHWLERTGYPGLFSSREKKEQWRRARYTH